MGRLKRDSRGLPATEDRIEGVAAGGAEETAAGVPGAGRVRGGAELPRAVAAWAHLGLKDRYLLAGAAATPSEPRLTEEAVGVAYIPARA